MAVCLIDLEWVVLRLVLLLFTDAGGCPETLNSLLWQIMSMKGESVSDSNALPDLY
jgi:hypothetical protein